MWKKKRIDITTVFDTLAYGSDLLSYLLHIDLCRKILQQKELLYLYQN